MKNNFLTCINTMKIFFKIILIILLSCQINNLFASDKNKSNEKASDELKIVSIKLNAIETDSSKKLIATVSTLNGNSIAGVEIHFYVQRKFGLLPIDSDISSTDESGNCTVEFPMNLPGDSLGNIIAIAKIEESELYKNTETHKTLHWGIPVRINHSRQQRALWAARANAPIYLIIIVNCLIIGVWFVIFYIIYQLYTVKKIGRYENEYSN